MRTYSHYAIIANICSFWSERGEAMGAWRTRLQNFLLVLIALLLFLNILLPARYTLQLVRIEPVSLDEEDGPVGENTTPASQSPTATEEATEAVVKTPREAASERSTPQPQRKAWDREGRVAPRSPRRLKAKDDIPAFPVWENERGDFMWQRRGGRAEKKDYRERVRESEDWNPERAGINLHDPAQRMAYYKKLRRRLVGGGPSMRTLQEQRFKRRQEMLQEMWEGWFEDDDQAMDLAGLEENMTGGISPEAIQAELTRCVSALGVSAQQIHSQTNDLKKTSVKLSAFIAAIKSIVPSSFSPQFSSPCWYSDRINTKSTILGITNRIIGLEGQLQILPNQATYLALQAFGGQFSEVLFCLPQFFLAGFPKSATTTLADALFGHPQVSGAVVKESHWWTRAPIISPHADLLKLNVLRYLMHFRRMAHFAQERPGLLAMDGSQSTLWDSNFVFNGHDFCSTPAAISHILPKAKFIVVMREPSERLYSYYLWSCSFTYGNDTRHWPQSVREDPAGNFHTEVTQLVTDFNHCMESHSLYECANRFTFKNGTKATHYCGQIGFRLVVSLYYIHIAKFLQFFPQEQFLFLKMEDMIHEPAAFLHRVTDFLDILPYPPREVRDTLERKKNQQKAGIEPMHEHTRQLLHDFFAPFNRQLAVLLGDNRFLWDYS